MSKSKQNIRKLGENDTVFVNTDELRVRANLRDGNTRQQYELNHEFGAEVECFVVRKAILQSGEIDLSNWTLVSEFSGQSQGFDASQVQF
jgi:hypothetical protein